MDLNALYQQWLEQATGDPDLTEELRDVAGKEDEILDRFYKKLEFGTAGLRGVLGAGTNRMNIYTVGAATQGLADFLNANYEHPSVTIAYDSRIKSDVFAVEAARILAGNHIKVYLFDELVPTPVLSYAVRYFRASSGIIITASHNPAKYNGFKCYDPNGYQMTDQAANATYQYIEKLDYFTDIQKVDFEAAKAQGLIEIIGQDVLDAFLTEVKKQQLHPAACKEAGLRVIYTPLNGTGNKPVRKILSQIGIDHVSVVPEQELPDGNFPTCPFPNPEIRQAFEYALKLAAKEPADLLLATDPDCDRVGIAVPDSSGAYQLMSGNEVGVMLLNYLLSQRTALGTLPERPIAVKTIVSTELTAAVAKKYGCALKDLLTGFKYIGELVTELENQGEADRFVFGYEESYGYLAGTHARDKDAVVASMLICEMASFYKLQGKSLIDVMNEIYSEFGMCLNQVESFQFEGAAGMEKMAQIMETLRREQPEAFGGLAVEHFIDYEDSDKTGLPKSNVLSYKMGGGNGLIVRPSGTEPKIKVYLTAMGQDKGQAQALADAFLKDVKQYFA